MNLTIPEALFRATTDCRHGFSCLETRCCGSQPVCRVNHVSGAQELSLDHCNLIGCPYWASHDGGSVCSCPLYHAVHPFLQEREPAPNGARRAWQKAIAP